MARAAAGAATPSALGKLIKEVRSRAGLSVQALARKASVAPIMISRVESGVRAKLEPATLAKLADALQIDVVPLLIASGVMPASRRDVTRRLTVDDRHALAERVAKLERRLDRDRAELSEIRKALLGAPER
jgi:transcriptional regulator with XRE-family HTH domain